MEELTGQQCPFCKKNELTLMEDRREIPFFGPVYLYSMTCEACKFHKADVEAESTQDPVRYTLDIESEEDMKIRVVKSSQATIKIPRIATITPGPASNGYVTNVEGVLNRLLNEIKDAKDNAEEDEERKKAKRLIKKLQRVIWGQEKLRMTIEDPSGNSAIISERAKVDRL